MPTIRHFLSVKRFALPRYFIFSVLLLLALATLYVFSAAQRLQRELFRQTEAKGMALAEAMEANVKNAILANSLLEDLIGQRLLDNARLIDQLLISRLVDRKLLGEIAAMNRLQKIELLDLKGRPLQPALPHPVQQKMEEILGEMRRMAREEAPVGSETMVVFMWGKRWSLPQEEGSREAPPHPLAERKFWEGSVFGVAIRARSFPGIIAVHANADYILNFRREMEVQRQVEELGRQSDIDHVAFLDNSLKILAHTDARLVNREETDAFIVRVKMSEEPGSRIVESPAGHRRYDVVKPIRLDGATVGFLEIGLSMEPIRTAWRKSMQSMFALALAILAVGTFGMATIFYNQHSHLRKIRLLEAEIGRQERLSELGNLAATVAHEIRNPLNSISMGLQRLRAEFAPTGDSEQYARFIDLMQGEVRRLNSIVEQFLSLARPLDLKPEELRIEELFTELSSFVGGFPKDSKVRFRVVTPPDLPAIWADRNYLKQLFLNLILNAIDAMPEGGTLTLEARVEDGTCILTVADSGSGIPPEVLPKIFEPYVTTKANGSGLGLAIARRIAEAHSGSIAVETQPGAGSRFHTMLPLRRAES